jgi:riboflavin kinase/FMN adenylyltransferase
MTAPRYTMEIVRGYLSVPAAVRGAAVAIGNFDGIHRGHQALLNAAKEIARQTSKPSGTVLFEPHPRQLFQPNVPLFPLTPLPRKLKLLEQLGLDACFVLDFNAELAALSAEAFMSEVLSLGLGVSHVVVGYDFRFGKGRSGSAELLTERGRSLGFATSVVPPVADGGEVFSSSAVRERLAAGDIDGANRILGHRWQAIGTVIDGAKRGRGLGFPTANIALPPGTSLGHGIYAAWVHVETNRHPSAVYFGGRPTFDDGLPMLEAFLLEFDGDLYGREIAVEMVARVRDDRKFDSIEALKAQIATDCARAHELLAADG